MKKLRDRERDLKSGRFRGQAMLLGVFFLGLWGMMIWKVDPVIVADIGVKQIYLPFFVLLELGLAGIIYGISLSRSSSLWWSLGIVLFMGLRLFGLGNILNGLLILSILATIEYVKKRNQTN